MVAVKSNAATIAKSIEAVRARLANLDPVMKKGAGLLDRVRRVAISQSTSPAGVKWPALADSTIEKRKRKGRGSSGLLALRGDTNNMIEDMFVQATKTGIRFGSGARSKDGYPYFLSHQFGAETRGLRKRTGYAKVTDRLIGPIRPGMTRQARGPAEYTGRKGEAWSRKVPQRAMFPVDSVAGKLVPMSGGPADRFFASLIKISTRYILKGK